MMGYSHAVSGACAWIAVTSATPVASGAYPLDAASVTAGAIICAGAALLPDADHPNATIAHSMPGVGAAAAGAIGAATGGHRHGMHSLLATAGVFLAMLALGQLHWRPSEDWPMLSVGAVAVTWALVTFGAKVLRVVRSWPRAWLLGGAVAAALAWFLPTGTLWLPLCVTLGYLVHLVGDMFTVGGVPLLWPIVPNPPKRVVDAPVLGRLWQRGGYFAIPVLGRTGSGLETVLASLLFVYALVGLGWMWWLELPPIG